jgi:hypothetical protein
MDFFVAVDRKFYGAARAGRVECALKGIELGM